jgi:predicted MPP superfamily phosphohydrolase
MPQKFVLLFILLFTILFSYSQNKFRFAHISDTHIGSANADEDLRRTVQNINNDTSLSFVIISGDITDFGSDTELQLAKQILDSLNKPWYIVPVIMILIGQKVVRILLKKFLALKHSDLHLTDTFS